MLGRFRYKLLAFLCGTCLDCKAIEGHNWHKQAAAAFGVSQ